MFGGEPPENLHEKQQEQEEWGREILRILLHLFPEICGYAVSTFYKLINISCLLARLRGGETAAVMRNENHTPSLPKRSYELPRTRSLVPPGTKDEFVDVLANQRNTDREVCMALSCEMLRRPSGSSLTVVRSCFYPKERLTLEPTNMIELSNVLLLC